MSEMLKRLCSGLPLNPLAENVGRDPSVAHAAKRVHNLNSSERKVARFFGFSSKNLIS